MPPLHKRRKLSELLLAANVGLIAACGSAGLYGHSQTYSPLDEEEDAAEHAVEYDPVMAKRFPDEWKSKVVSIFGIVESRSPGPSGTTLVTLSVRTLEPRNLCETVDEDTCRVTVSENEHGVVHAVLKLRPDDDIGEHSVGTRSLVRVIGTLTSKPDAQDGEPVAVAKYYRHWPYNFYVTTAARTFMRR